MVSMKPMKIALWAMAMSAVVVIWALERMTATNLRAQIELLRTENLGLDDARGERTRLQQNGEEREQRARSQREAARRATLERQNVAPQVPAAPPAQAVLAVGEWLPPSSWQNRGQGTPTAAVETVLWAAGGGDIATMKNMLELDDTVRANADALRATLPEFARAIYPSAEHLIASFTTKAIPLGDAQLVWQHQSEPDEAFACLFLRHSGQPAGERPTDLPPPGENIPPMGPSDSATSLTYLSLRRSGDRWRLVVPTSAVEVIAKELGATVAR